jgi:hypothetical protein
MRTAAIILLLNTVLLGQPLIAPAAEKSVDLLAEMRAAGASKLTASSATVYSDERSGCMTITFHYIHGDPQVSIPVAALGAPSDWSSFRAISFDMRSTSLEPFFIKFSNGNSKKEIVIEPLEGLRIQGMIPIEPPTSIENERTPRQKPLGYKIWPNALDVTDGVGQISFRMHNPAEPTQVTLCDFALKSETLGNDILDRHPVIDRYGQWIPEKWDDKAYSDGDLKSIWAKEDLRPVKYPYCPLGGDPEKHLRSTGFFRTEEIGNRWALVDPHGHPFYSAGIDILNVADTSFSTSVADREYLYEELPPDGSAWLDDHGHKVVSFYAANLARRYGADWKERGNQHMVERYHNWGLNTIGNWSDKDFARRSGMPYVLPLYGWTTKKYFSYPYGLPDVFSEEFRKNVDAAAREQVSALKDDPNLIGWFLDNEPVWGDDFTPRHPWADIVLGDPEPSATQTKLKELLAANPNDSERIKKDFLYTCVKEMLGIVIAAVRKYDPNHLILGVRFAGRPPEQMIRIASMFDVFSVNIYTESFAPDQEAIRQYSELSGRPVLIGEFTAAAPGRGLQGVFYGLHKARDQAERGVAYRYFVENSVASPYIVGTHWFQLVDDLPTGRGDLEHINYGFVNVVDQPYEDLVKAARQTHLRLYDLMFGRVRPTDVKPVQN